MPKAKKSLGQNFLIDPAVTNKILRFINPDSKDIFLEIGPGKGAITKQLTSRVDITHAVEVDKELSYKLKRLEDEKKDRLIEYEKLQKYREQKGIGHSVS